jgi:hypothetical protein
MADSPPPETLDWLRQCAAAPGARWHRALLAEVEGQTPPEIEPIPAEGLAWLHQSARVHGATYSQVLLHVLERIELLDKDAIERSQSSMPKSRSRQFASLTRTPTPQGSTVLDAIDTDGRAWWLVLGDDGAPDDWSELKPLPTYEAQP